MKWENIIKSSPLQKFAKIAENNGLHIVDEQYEEDNIMLIPKKYRFMNNAFYYPFPLAEFLPFNLGYGVYIPAADMKDVPTVDFGNKTYKFHQQKERGKVTLDEEEFLKIIKKYKEFCKEHKDKFLKLFTDKKNLGY